MVADIAEQVKAELAGQSDPEAGPVADGYVAPFDRLDGQDGGAGGDQEAGELAVTTPSLESAAVPRGTPLW